MERGLALVLFVVMSLGIVMVKLLTKSGVLDLRTEWHRYIADHTNLWLILISFVYDTLCEMARGNKTPKIVLTLMRALGFLLAAAFAYLFGCVVFGF